MGGIFRGSLRSIFLVCFLSCVFIPGVALSETTVRGSGDFYALPLQVDSLDSIVSIAPSSGKNLIASVQPQTRIQRNLLLATAINGPWDGVATLESGDNVRGLAFWQRNGRFRTIENISRQSGGRIRYQQIHDKLINDFQTFFSGRFYPGTSRQYVFISPRSGENRIIRVDASGKVEAPRRFIDQRIINDFEIAVAGDFDGDNRTDLFLWERRTGSNRFVLNRIGVAEEEKFDVDSFSQTLVNGNDFEGVHAADLDGDGKDELFFYNLGTGRQRLIDLNCKPDVNKPDCRPQERTNPLPQALIRGQGSIIAGNFLSQRGDELALIGDQGQLRIESLLQSAGTGTTGINLIPGGNDDPLANLPEDPRERGDRLIAAVEELAERNGGTLRLPPVDFILNSPLDVPSNTLISGAPGSTIFLDVLKFNNQDPTNVDDFRRGNSVGFKINGKSNVTIEGLTIRLFHPGNGSIDRRFVRAITIRNSNNVVIRNNDIASFSNANGIITIDSTNGVSVSDNNIHDCFTDHVVRVNGKDFVQITGINVDDQRINGRSSQGVTIERNTIRNLLVSDRIADTRGFETDGINVSTRETQHVTIRFNQISNVREGIDHFGSDGRIHCNEIINPRLFGIKLIHGASRNKVHDNLVSAAGNSAFVFGSSRTVSSCDHTSGNEVFKNEIRGVRRGTFAFKFDAISDGACSLPINNTIRDNGYFSSEGGATFILRNNFPNVFINNGPNPDNFVRSCGSSRDEVDECPNDPDKMSPGVCGCNNPELDSDFDGIIDCGSVINEDVDEDDEASIPFPPQNEEELRDFLGETAGLHSDIDLGNPTARSSVRSLLDRVTVLSSAPVVRSSRARKKAMNRILKSAKRLDALMNKSGGKKIAKRQKRMLKKLGKLLKRAQRLLDK